MGTMICRSSSTTTSIALAVLVVPAERVQQLLSSTSAALISQNSVICLSKQNRNCHFGSMIFSANLIAVVVVVKRVAERTNLAGKICEWSQAQVASPPKHRQPHRCGPSQVARHLPDQLMLGETAERTMHGNYWQLSLRAKFCGRNFLLGVAYFEPGEAIKRRHFSIRLGLPGLSCRHTVRPLGGQGDEHGSPNGHL